MPSYALVANDHREPVMCELIDCDYEEAYRLAKIYKDDHNCLNATLYILDIQSLAFQEIIQPSTEFQKYLNEHEAVIRSWRRIHNDFDEKRERNVIK